MKYSDVFFDLFLLSYTAWILYFRWRAGRVLIKLPSSSLTIGLLIGIFAMIYALHNFILHGADSYDYTVFVSFVCVRFAWMTRLCSQGIFINSTFIPWEHVQSAKWSARDGDFLYIGVDDPAFWNRFNVGKEAVLKVPKMNREVIQSVIQENVPASALLFTEVASEQEPRSTKVVSFIWGIWILLAIALIFGSKWSIVQYWEKRSVASIPTAPTETPQSLHLGR